MSQVRWPWCYPINDPTQGLSSYDSTNLKSWEKICDVIRDEMKGLQRLRLQLSKVMMSRSGLAAEQAFEDGLRTMLKSPRRFELKFEYEDFGITLGDWVRAVN